MGKRSNVKNDTQDFSLSKGLMELTFTEMGRLWEGQEGRISSLFGVVKFYLPIRCLRRAAEQATGSTSLE